MLVAEALLLLLTDEDSGRTPVGAPVATGLGGALLVDLVEADRVWLDGPTKKATVEVRDATPAGHPALDPALAAVAAKPGRRASGVVDRLGRGAADRLYRGLAADRVLRRERRRWLWVLPMTVWPAVDPAPRRALVDDLRAALVQGATPTDRTAALAALLLATDQLGVVVERDERRGAKQRARELAEGDAASAGVHSAVRAAQAAVAAAVTAATVTTSAGGS